jgi:hypothetical protein
MCGHELQNRLSHWSNYNKLAKASPKHLRILGLLGTPPYTDAMVQGGQDCIDKPKRKYI